MMTSNTNEGMPVPDNTNTRRAAAAAATFDARGLLLLQRRTDNGCWALPGGTVEIGETVEQAVVREVKEETGYDVRVLRLVGVYSTPEDTTITYPDGNTVCYVSVLFECEVIGGSRALSDESSAVEWFDPASLPEPFHDGHRPRVEDALARQIAAFYR